MDCDCKNKSYLTIAEANDYFNTRYGGEFWSTLSLDAQKKALITATRRIDTLPFIGYKCSPYQPLQFPRYFVDFSYALDIYTTAIVPQAIKDATAEEALSIAQYIDVNGEDAFNGAISTNMQSLKLGDASITYGSGGSGTTSKGNATNSYGLFSDEAAKLLSGYIKVGLDIVNPRFYEVY